MACIDGHESEPWCYEPEPYQRELPAQEAEWRAKANAYKRLLLEAEAHADVLALETKRLAERGPMAGLCPAHRQHLHKPTLVARWMGGRLGLSLSSAKAKPLIREVLEYVRHPDHQPGLRGSCLVCDPASKYQEEQVSA